MEKEKIVRLVEAGQRKEAIACLEKELNGADDEQLLLLLGELYQAEGRTIDALNTFNIILRNNPNHTKATTYVAMINSVLNYYNKDLLNP